MTVFYNWGKEQDVVINVGGVWMICYKAWVMSHSIRELKR